MMKGIVRVNPDGTSLKGIRDFDGSVEVSGVNRGGKTVRSSVSDTDGLLLILEFRDGSTRARRSLLA